MEFSENLKYLRNSTQCTQKKLAEHLGLSANTVCEWEKNRSEPSIQTIRKLAEFFDVSADYLLGLEDDFGARTATNAAPMGERLTEKEKTLLEAFRQLLPETQDFILRSTQGMNDSNPAKKFKKV